MKGKGYVALLLVFILPLTGLGVVLTSSSSSSSGIIYLWYRSSPRTSVIVIRNGVDRNPSDVDELNRWRLNGDACLAESGTKAYRESITISRAYVTIPKAHARLQRIR